MKLIFTFLAVRIEDYMLPCFTKKIFSFDCPGCGLQRAFVFLLRGDFLAAWEMYPAIFAIIPLFGVIGLNQIFKLKYYNAIISSLLTITVGLIVTNYISKFT